MTPVWGDLNARARGLGTRLARREVLESLAGTPDVATLASRWIAPGALDLPRSPAEIEGAMRRDAARNMALLERWAGSRRDLLRVVFEEEDRRSVRAMIRGAAQGAPPERRLAGLIPTSSLPGIVLAALARRESVLDTVSRLAEHGHPYGAPLLPQAKGRTPDLFRLELELDRLFTRRSTTAAVNGGKHLEAYARQVVDLENAWALLWADAYLEEVSPAEVWLEGGAVLKRERFEEISRVPVDRRRALLGQAFGRSRLARVFLDDAIDRSELERRALAARIAEQRQASRLDPLGPAPLLEYVLRLRAAVTDCQRIVWGVALGTPPSFVLAELATPP